MGALLAPVIVAAALLAPALRPASPVRWLGCPGTVPSLRPSSHILACGDGNARFGALTWSSWGTRSARGEGEYLYTDCVPDCALGTPHRKMVTLWLGSPRDIWHSGHRYWTSLTVRFTGSKPARARWVERLHWSRGFWRF